MDYILFLIHLLLNQNFPQVHLELLQYAHHWENGTVKMNITPTARTLDPNVTVNSWLCFFPFFFFWNSATKHPQMAAPNRGLVSESFHATQTQVQVMYVTVYTWIYRHELCSGMDLIASWKRPSLAGVWASKCYVNFGCMWNASSLGDTRSYMYYAFSSVLLR